MASVEENWHTSGDSDIAIITLGGHSPRSPRGFAALVQTIKAPGAYTLLR